MARVKALVRLRTCTVLSVPLGAYRALPAELLRCRTVWDTGDVCPSRDGRIADLDSDEITTSELPQRLRPGALLVKAFNNILAHHIPDEREQRGHERPVGPMTGVSGEAAASGARPPGDAVAVSRRPSTAADGR
jgi:predicted dinucleotide-binding enzyme